LTEIESIFDESKPELKVEGAKVASNISFMYLKLSKEGNDETLLQNARKYAMLSISHNPNCIKGYLRLAEACKESERTEDILNAITLYLNNNKDAATVLNDDFKKLLQQVKYYTHNKVMKLSPSWDLLKYKSNVYVIDPLGAGHFKNFEEFISYYGTSVQKISLLVRPGTYIGSYVLTNATINIVGDCNIEINPITKAIDKDPIVVFTNTLQPTEMIAIEKMSCPHKIPSTFFFEGCEVTLQRISVYGEVAQYPFQAINCQTTHLKVLQCSFVSKCNSGLCCSENSKLDCKSCCSVGGYNGVVIGSKSHAKLSDCFVSKMDAVGIIANDQAEMIILKHCTVTKCKRQGLVVYDEAKMAKVLDSFFKDNGSGLINVASIHFKCCKVLVENTSVQSPGCTGIGIEGGSGSYNNLNIKNCDTGLLVQANVQISNCTIKSSNIGIQVTGAVTLENNKISKCSVEIAKSDGSPMPTFKGGKKNAVVSMPPLDEVTQSAFKDIKKSRKKATRDAYIGSDYDRLGLNEINCNHCSLNKEVIKARRLPNTLKACSGCRLIYYCSLECQRKGWKLHKPHCKSYIKLQANLKMKNAKSKNTAEEHTNESGDSMK